MGLSSHQNVVCLFVHGHVGGVRGCEMLWAHWFQQHESPQQTWLPFLASPVSRGPDWWFSPPLQPLFVAEGTPLCSEKLHPGDAQPLRCGPQVDIWENSPRA